MGQNVPKIGQNYILMTRIEQKSRYWSEMVKILKLDVPNMFELVQNWLKMGKNKISIRFT